MKLCCMIVLISVIFIDACDFVQMLKCTGLLWYLGANKCFYTSKWGGHLDEAFTK